MEYKFALYLFSIILIVSNISCKKYLDEKTNKKFVIPSSVEDFQAMLDRYQVMNQVDPGASEVASDNYFLSDVNWSSLAERDRRMYTWEKDFIFPDYPNNWSNVYNIVYIANTCIEGLDKISNAVTNKDTWEDAKGQALFYRAKSFLQAAIIWAPAYDKSTSQEDLGVPLRLSSDFNIPSVRSSLEDTYHQITIDLREAVALLPTNSIHQMRPSKPAAYALLARAYLSMREYDSCLKYSDLCLQLKSDLIDYNGDQGNINLSASTYKIVRFNKEVIHESYVPAPPPISNARAKIDSNLYNSYNSNDLRKGIFFKSSGVNTYMYVGSYVGSALLWDGVATDEVFLMRAECYARKEMINEAMNDLNTLMIKRWKNTAWVPFQSSDLVDALNKILTERRKELVMRMLRWMDIKRLNKEGANITLKRLINGQIYLLQPNDSRYAMAIPEDVISLSGLQQNPR